MFKNKFQRWNSFSTLAVLLVVLILFLTGVFSYTREGMRVGAPEQVQAATSSNLNMQARLYNASGSVVPDGYYNIQFKLYDQLSGGTALWTETWYDSNGASPGNDNRVRVVNGYLSVPLGTHTPFGAINWDQDLWISLNVGGTDQTSSPTYDGEMSPRIKLTAVPYAFQSKQSEKLLHNQGTYTGQLDFDTLTDNRSILLPDADGTVCLTSGNCVGLGSYGDILQGGNSFDDDVTIGTNDNYNLNFETNGVTVATLTAAGQLQLDVQGSSGGLLIGGDTNLYRDSANVLKTDDSFSIQSSSANAFLIEDATGNDVLSVDTTDSYAVLKLGGTGKTHTELRLHEGATDVWSIGTDDSGLGGTDGFYIFDRVNSDYVLGLNSSTGAATFRNGTDSPTAFQVQNAAGTSQLTVDTTNSKVIVERLEFAGDTEAQFFRPGDNFIEATGQLAADWDIWARNEDPNQVIIGAMGPTDEAGIFFGLGSGNNGTIYLAADKTLQTDSMFVLGQLAADPTGINGGVYYNSSANEFRCYVNGSWEDCYASAGISNLQEAYDGGNTMLTTDGKDIDITLADTATDSNFTIDIASGSTGQFQIQANGTNTFTVNGTGQTTLRNSSNSTTAFDVQDSSGLSVFTVDTTNGFVGIRDTTPDVLLDLEVNTTQDGFIRVDVEDGFKAGLQLWETSDRGFNLFYDASASNLVLQTDVTGVQNNVMTVSRDNGATQFKTYSGADNAFQVQNASSAVLFNVSSEDGGVTVGGQVDYDDLQGHLRIWGPNSGAGGRIFFGDSAFAWIGETGTTDTDALTIFSDETLTIDAEEDHALTVNNTSVGASNVWIELQHEGVAQWELGANSSGTFYLYDDVDDVDRLEVNRSGALVRVNNASSEGLTVENQLGDEFMDLQRSTYGTEDYAELVLGESGGGTFDASQLTLTNDGSNRWSVGTSDDMYSGADSFYIWDEANGEPAFMLNSNSNATFYSANSATAFQIWNQAQTSIFTADTSNNRIYIGNPTADSTGSILVLDTKNTSGDPTGVNGAMYYSSAMDKFRCHENGAWGNCGSLPSTGFFQDGTNDTLSDSNSNLWDSATYPNLTITNDVNTVLVSVVIYGNASANDDEYDVFTIHRAVGSNPTCASPQVGTGFVAYTTNSSTPMGTTATFVDAPASTGNIRYTICSNTDSVSSGGSVDNIVDVISITLQESGS